MYTNIDVEELAIQINTCILNISKNLPHIKFNKCQKPYWDTELNDLSKYEKKVRWDWIQAGKPKHDSNPIYIRYKSAKSDFRRNQRQKSYICEKITWKKFLNLRKLTKDIFGT